jgi:8-oxo-dGTP diphosphatase
MDPQVAKIYGNKVRVRACGLCWKDDSLLMVNHHGITPTNFWCPPGGGVEFGQSIPETLQQEFCEETGLIITPGKFMFGCEYIAKPIHSIELFYEVNITAGELKIGADPEIQIINDVRFIDFEMIKKFPPQEQHGIFRWVERPDNLRGLTGFYRI